MSCQFLDEKTYAVNLGRDDAFAEFRDAARSLIGADVKLVNRTGQTTVDMANGPVQRVQPYPDTIALLEKLGAKNNHKCVSC